MRPRDTLTVVRPGSTTTDRYGDPVYVDDAGTPWPAYVQQLTTTENDVARDIVTTRYRAWLPAEADIVATDRVLYNGLELEVIGDPDRPMSYKGPSHVEVELRGIQ